MENIKIEGNTKFFAPGNLRAVNENAEYKELVDYWISKNFTLRYSLRNLHVFIKYKYTTLHYHCNNNRIL